MSLAICHVTTGMFVRGLINLRRQLRLAQHHAAVRGMPEVVLLQATLDPAAPAKLKAPRDVHGYTLAAHAHWAAAGAIASASRLLGASFAQDAQLPDSFTALDRQLTDTVAQLVCLAPDELEVGLDREVEVAHPRGTQRGVGRQYLLGMAIPHFYYHLVAAHGILRLNGMPLTMSDFIGEWGSN